MDFDDDDPIYSDSDESLNSVDDDIAIDPATANNEDDRTDYTILNQNQLLIEMNGIATETSSVLGFSLGSCKILLHHFRWNREDLIEKFYEAGDKDKFLQEYNVMGGCTIQYAESICDICYEKQQLTGLPCGHLFCSDCWVGYLTVKIKDEGCALVPCPGLKCASVVPEELMKRFQFPEDLLNSNRKLVINSFVMSNSKLKWCPAADCGRVVKVPHPECRAIKCQCGMVFCFNCSNEWHEPVNCEMLKNWLKKCSDDSETSNWLNANTKDCPQCHVTIEKDGGCNHMTCKNVSCRFEFCWTCLGPWKPHGSGWYSCNRFDDTDAKRARDDQERSRAALQRYLHYYNRFMNHQNSLKLEHKLYAQVQEKMLQMQQRGFSWIETQFLRKAVDVLSECRRTLMYTYAFAFYLKQNNMTNIFEANQQDLELSTEQLSEFLERDLEKENLVSLKQKVQDKYRYVQQRRSALLDHVVEGVDRNEWDFTNRT